MRTEPDFIDCPASALWPDLHEAVAFGQTGRLNRGIACSKAVVALKSDNARPGAMLGLDDLKLFRRAEYRLPTRIEAITSVTPRVY